MSRNVQGTGLKSRELSKVSLFPDSNVCSCNCILFFTVVPSTVHLLIVCVRCRMFSHRF